MKRTLLLIIALLGLLAVLPAVPRNLVVVEVATGTWCQYCPGAAMGCHDLLLNDHPVAIVKNHNGDSYANVYSNARNSFYNPSGYPTAYFDGLNPSVGGSSTASMYSNYLPKVNARMNVPSHFTISAVGAQVGNDFQIGVTVAKPEADTNTNVKLHAVLTESNIPQVWFNQTTVENVNRLMSPNQNGTAIDLDTGASTTVNLTLTPNPSWNLANCEVVFFLQNMTSKEILQGVKYSLAGLVGAYPISTDNLAFPDMYVSGSATIPVTITNFLSDPASGTIAIDNPAFSSSVSNFNIPGTSSIIAEITFTPTAAQTYSGTMTITSNLYNHPNITIPLSGTGFVNAAPTATNVVVTGPPVLYQEQTASYQFNDGDGNTEGSSVYQWFRIVNNTPQAIAGADQLVYSAVEEDLGFPIAFQVTPVDQHGMPGTPVMSEYTIPIEVLPPPQNLQATVTPPSTVNLSWERPEHFDGKGLVGYRLYRNGLTISTITNPATLTFTDTYVPIGTHEYWICTLFNNPMMLSDPSNVVTVNVGVDNDDQIAPAEISVSVHPNPFQSTTAISIQSKADASVELAIYNIRGQLVKSFALTADNTGSATLNWDGSDAQGQQVNSGVYYYRMSSAGRLRNGRIVLMK
ncbi:MAG: FlgD immunoglobulin-like domain containing protein [Candidatus Cloacimonetes bacterium]|nr:FlgD immunoglobulin-like domain containing protein [Candidatus Cloacimonadota bacterium]